MSRFSVRSNTPEIMDDLACSGEVVHQTLRELEFINKWLGGNAITFSGVDTLLKGREQAAVHIADLGCGSGEMLKLISQRLQSKGIKPILTGIDANPNIIEYAKKNCAGFSGIHLATENILAAEFQQRKFDIIVATLFFHHFTSAQLIDILKQLKKQADVGIVINDLHRHPLAFYSIKLLTKLFSKSGMVKYDAPLSVLRGFTRNELVGILKGAGITRFTLRWKWAFRWQVIIPATGSPG
ncbi:MAG: methyltransferase domain-containing protein [Cyclobacteriaceae bacterium]|nr:methyltransferase domain-containing protein [Cyclobacteriaceae bacterium]